MVNKYQLGVSSPGMCLLSPRVDNGLPDVDPSEYCAYGGGTVPKLSMELPKDTLSYATTVSRRLLTSIGG